MIFEVLLAQTWSKKQFYLDSQVCNSNEKKCLWFKVPWGTRTTELLSWNNNNYVLMYFLFGCCFAVLYGISVERFHLIHPLKIPEMWDSLKMRRNLCPAKDSHVSGEEKQFSEKTIFFSIWDDSKGMWDCYIIFFFSWKCWIFIESLKRVG